MRPCTFEQILTRQAASAAALVILVGAGPAMAPAPAMGATESASSPPVAQRIPASFERHGIAWVDYYDWMKDVTHDNQAAIAYVEAENAYTDAVMRPTLPMQEALFEEMKARIKETDLDVPVRVDDYFYYSRTQAGENYRIYCRKPGSLEGAEEVTLDVNELAREHAFYDVADLIYSPDHRLLAFAADTTGSERYTVCVKDLTTGQRLPDELYPVRTVVWANDNRTLFYVREKDPDTESPYQLYRHALGTPQTEDVLLYEEADLGFGLALQKTRSQAYIILLAGNIETSECRILRADEPLGEFRLVAPREAGVEYSLHHWEDSFFIVTNLDGAVNYKVMRAPVDQPGREHWREYIAHRDSVYLTGFDVFRDWMAIHERKQGLETIRVQDMRSGETHCVGFPDPTYTFFSDRNPNYDAQQYRFTYFSLVTPRSVYDYDFQGRALKLLKRTEVLGGFDPQQYHSEWLHATARDGAQVPISLVYRSDRFRKDGSNPMLLYAYGAYGISSEPYFSSLRLTLLDRGFVYAIAHVRGGDELGEAWHDQGKLLRKKNTYRDFIDCAEYLIEHNYTRAERLVINGGSAGGMLMGAVANMRPDLFRVIVAEVPAVDELTTMLDPTLRGVEFHYTEWGNPGIRDEFEYMASWDPYWNIRRQPYPDMLVTAGLSDPRVAYWEPAKYVARLRALKTDHNLLLMRTNMSGHGGASGRYDYLREVAFQYAFIFERLRIAL
jgi:oligopeptidase B